MTKVTFQFVYLIFLGCIILSSAGYSQEESIPNQLVKYNGGQITAAEFSNRLNFSYPMKRGSLPVDSIKKEYLYSLIAEKLWALEAKDLHLDTAQALADSYLPLFRFITLDEFYKDIVLSKVVVDDKEILPAVDKFRHTLQVVVYSSPSEALILSARNRLIQGLPVKATDGISTTSEPISIIFGQIEDEAIEDSVYLLPIDSLSAPLYANGKWFLFRMVAKGLTDIAGMSDDALYMNVKQIMRRRRASNFENAFRDSLFTPLHIETDAQLFKLAAKGIAKILINRYKSTEWDTSKAVTLYQDDAIILQKEIGQKNLEANFILFKERPITLREALRWLPFHPVELKHPTNKKISAILQEFFKYVIEQEVLYREAVKFGYDKKLETEAEAGIWKDNLLASLYSTQQWKEVSVNAEKPDTTVYYEVVSVKSIMTLLEIMSTMKHGQSFDSVYVANKGFVIPDDSPIMTPKVKELLAAQMKSPLRSNPPGVYGAFESGGNYILLRKRPLDKLMPEKLSSAPGIRKQQIKHRYDEQMEKITAKLFQKYAVSIDKTAYDNVSVTGLNTYTVHYMGFGNKLPAYPMTTPFGEWIRRLPANKLP